MLADDREKAIPSMEPFDRTVLGEYHSESKRVRKERKRTVQWGTLARMAIIK